MPVAEEPTVEGEIMAELAEFEGTVESELAEFESNAESEIFGEFEPEGEMENPEAEDRSMMGTFITLYALYIVFIVASNLVVIITILTHKRLKLPTYQYMTSLAFADVCIGGFVIPNGIFAYFSDAIWGSTLCRICEFFSNVSKAARTICLLQCAVDRFRTNVLPSHPVWTIKQTRIAIVLGWGCAFLYAARIPPIIGLNIKKVPMADGSTMLAMLCAVSDEHDALYRILVMIDFLLFYFLPLVVITFLYSVMVMVMLQRNRKERLEKERQLALTGTAACFEKHEEEQESSQKRMIKMITTLILLLTFFGVCKLPIHALHLYVYWGPGWFPEVSRIRQIFDMISFSNSLFNAICIVGVDNIVRREFIEMVRHKHRERKKKKTIKKERKIRALEGEVAVETREEKIKREIAELAEKIRDEEIIIV